MDRYEYRTKMEQIDKAKSIGDYQTAGRIAETIEWSRVKRVAVLCDIADIYDRIGRYEDCREILLMAYERSPIGRMIVYRLCDVSIKLKNLEDAKEYFDSFLELAPSDPHKFILQYKMEKTAGAPIDRLITILENLKSREFMENWAYELAYLYHKKGLITQCVDECNDIFLWFGEGKYVEKALELKLLHQPLTPLQMERYEYMRAKRISEQKRANRKVAVDYEPKVPSEDEMDITPVEVKVDVYNTVNLQKELAKNLDQIMNATGNADVTKSLDNVKSLVNASNIPELKIEEQEPTVEPEEDSSFNDAFKSILAEEYDGQISLIVPDEQPEVEKQITGQLSIEDVLAEWDMKKRAVDKAYEAETARRFESDKARAIAQTEGIIAKLGEVMPKYQEANVKAREEAAAAGRRRLETEENLRSRAEAGKPPGVSNVVDLFGKAAEPVKTPGIPVPQVKVTVPTPPEVELLKKPEPERAEEKEDKAQANEPDTQPVREDAPGLQFEQRKAEIEARKQAEIEERERIMKEAEEARRIELARMQKAEEETRMRIKAEAEAKRKAAEEAARKAEEEERARMRHVEEERLKKQKAAEEEARLQQQLQAVEEPEEAVEEPAPEEIEEKEQIPSWEEASNTEVAEAMRAADEAKRAKILSDTEKLPPIVIKEYVLSEEQKEEFSYFMHVKGVEDQICKLLCDMKNDHARGLMYKSNIIISGAPGMGKTKLAASLAKVIQQIGLKESGKFGKISSDKLNVKSVEGVFAKVAGGCLVIEKAASLDKPKAKELLDVMTNGGYDVTVILEDAPAGLSRLLGGSFELAERFTNHVSIPIFNNDELISFGRAYAAEQGFTIDEMGVLAMYKQIGFMQYSKQDTMLEEVMDIVDDAIRKATKGLFKFGRKKEGILKEKDFE